MSQRSKSSVTTIDAALAEPAPDDQVASEVASAVEAHRALRAAYAGGLTAEQESWRKRRKQTRSAIRSAWVAGRGRRINLVALLRQRDQQGRPIWTVADPTGPVGRLNGGIDADGTANVIRRGKRLAAVIESGRPLAGGNAMQPDGLPPLPPQARRIVTDRAVAKRAKWIGVLYQPETWHEIDPDPAVVVEWADRPGEYYCLAVWGGDRAQIEEFVD